MIRNIFLKITKYRFADLYVLSVLLFLIIVNLVSFELIKSFYLNIALNLFFGIFIIWIIHVNEQINKYGSRQSSGFLKNLVILTRNLYYGIAILLVYTQFQVLIKAFHPIDYDIMLNNWDIALIGMKAGDLTSSITFPALTEYLQIAYSTFYFLPLIVGIEVYRFHDNRFDSFIRNILFTYFFSYFLYFFLPAIGPRFVFYDFFNLNKELPGLFLSDFLRNTINYGGGVINKTVDPSTIVNRDCMPSGHTMVTIINIIFAFRYKVKSRYLILIFGISIIIATIYMRYHYFVDIIAGIIFAFVSLWFEPKYNKFFKKIFAIN